ncbi:hypothetical protein ABIB45_004398 [Arthrobacter sp. UYCo732]
MLVQAASEELPLVQGTVDVGVSEVLCTGAVLPHGLVQTLLQMTFQH